MNNLSSYFGLVDARISASKKDLPVPISKLHTFRKIIGHFVNLSKSIIFTHTKKINSARDQKCQIGN